MKRRLSLLSADKGVKAYVHYALNGEILNEKGDIQIQPAKLHENFGPVQDLLERIGQELFQSRDRIADIVMTGRNYNLGCLSFEVDDAAGREFESLVVVFDTSLPASKIPGLLSSTLLS